MTKRTTYIFGSILGVLLLPCLIFFVDKPLSLALHQLDIDHTSWINVFRDYTDLGKSVWWLWPSGLGALACAFLLRVKKFQSPTQAKIYTIGTRLSFLFLTVAIAGLTTDTIKPMIGRARPLELLRYDIYSFSPFTFKAAWNSFPSGHATTAFALMFVINWYCPKLRWLWITGGLLLALSRVMVNAHYLSDVYAGFYVSWLCFEILKRVQSRSGMFHLMQCIFPIDRK